MEIKCEVHINERALQCLVHDEINKNVSNIIEAGIIRLTSVASLQWWIYIFATSRPLKFFRLLLLQFNTLFNVKPLFYCNVC